jgi:hypothetical protein
MTQQQEAAKTKVAAQRLTLLAVPAGPPDPAEADALGRAPPAVVAVGHLALQGVDVALRALPVLVAVAAAAGVDPVPGAQERAHA